MKPTPERAQSSFVCFILESRRVETKSYTAGSRIDKVKEETKQINEYKKRHTKAGRAYF